MKPSFDDEMRAANKIGSLMVRAAAQEANKHVYKDYPEAVVVYAAVFALAELASQMEAKHSWVIDLVKDVLKENKDETQPQQLM